MAVFFEVRFGGRGIPGNVLLSEIYAMACSETERTPFAPFLKRKLPPTATLGGVNFRTGRLGGVNFRTGRAVVPCGVWVLGEGAYLDVLS